MELVKEKQCIFKCKTPNEVKLFFLSTKNVGQRFLFIKENTKINKIRAALSIINESHDFSAVDVKYHCHILQRIFPCKKNGTHDVKIAHLWNVSYNLEEIKAVIEKYCFSHITQYSGGIAKLLLQDMNQYGF